MVGVGGREGRWCSLSVSLPAHSSPMPAAHPVLKAPLPPDHAPQPLLHPNPALHTEQLEASENDQHSTLSPWPRRWSLSDLLHSYKGACTKKTPLLAPNPIAPPQQPP